MQGLRLRAFDSGKNLQLKYIVHSGEFVEQSVAGLVQLFGRDVNLALRLLRDAGIGDALSRGRSFAGPASIAVREPWHSMPVDLGLNGKVALVAAASKGLGRAIAEEFAREGAKVAMCSREEAAITAAADDIRKKTNGDVLSIAADLSTQAGCETFVSKAVAKYGALDILIVNAGGPPPGRFDDLDDAAWHKAVDLTLFSAVRLTRLALPQMRKQRAGSIVYSTSTSVRQPTQYLNLILSNAIRASVHGMLKTLSSDLAKDGIRVNAVQPGRIATDRLIQLDTDTAKRQNTTPEAVRKRYEESVIPMGRYGDPAEYAAAVVFIASPKASYITGVSLQVDGGMLMSMF